MEISERFVIMIDSLGMNNNSFALSIGKSPSNMKPIIDGKTKPGWEMLELILTKYPQINPAWLMKGEGHIFINQKHEVKKEETTNDLLPVMWNSLKENYERTIEDLRYTVSLQREMLMGKLESNEQTRDSNLIVLDMSEYQEVTYKMSA